MGDSPLLGSGSVNPNIDYRLQKLKKKKRRMGRVTKVPWSRAFFNDNHHVAHAVCLQTDQKLQQH